MDKESIFLTTEVTKLHRGKKKGKNMKLSKISTGLLINFNVELLKDGIQRFKI